MNQYRDNKGNDPHISGGGMPDVHGKTRKAVAAPRLCLAGTLVAAAVAAALGAGDWGVRPAMAGEASQKGIQAAPRPPLTLSVGGPTKAKAGVPLEGITVRLANTGLALRDSRLRLFVHDGQERSVGPDDIKIEVREKGGWKPVLAEPIDEGVMGAIGAEGEAHKEPHKSGGFAIGNKANKVLQLRLTFRLPGRYAMVMSVSPDNGETQLAQPVSVNLEAL